MPFCNKCGKKVADDAEFCPSCGKKLTIKEATTSAPTCPKCKNKLIETDKFCARCGTTVKREITRTESRKNPQIAAILNFFIPGAGYLYAGKRVALGIGLVAVLTVISLMIIGPRPVLPSLLTNLIQLAFYLYFPLMLVLFMVGTLSVGPFYLTVPLMTVPIIFGFVFAYDVFKQTKRENGE